MSCVATVKVYAVVYKPCIAIMICYNNTCVTIANPCINHFIATVMLHTAIDKHWVAIAKPCLGIANPCLA